MLWIGETLLPPDGSRKVPTTALCSFVNQLNTARRFMWNKVTKQSVLWMQHHNFTVGGFVMISVGIDVAKDKHDCFIINSEGEVLADVFTIPNNMDGFQSLLQRIRNCSSPQDKIKVGLEATGHYSYNILGFLLDNGLPTYVLNPLHTNLYRKSLSLRKTKTDRVDARTIAAMLLSDVGLKPYTDTAYHNEELKSLTRYRFDKVKERGRLKQSIARLVCILFPELEKLVPTLHMVSVYALLEEFPGAKQIAQANLTRLKTLLHDASRGRYGRDMAVDIRETARKSIGSVMPAKSLELCHTIHLIRELDAEIDEIETAFQNIMNELHSPITTIPGIGTRMGAMILAEVGDFSRFGSPDKLLAYAGLSPSTYQSGQLKNCYAHMEKRGSRYLRFAIFNAAKYVCHWDPVFAAYLAKKRAEGKHYNVAISHAAKKIGAPHLRLTEIRRALPSGSVIFSE
jgi:transposase